MASRRSVALRGKEEEGRMVRGKDRGIPCQDGLDGGLGVELVRQEGPDRVSIPAVRMDELAIEREVPVVERPGLKMGNFGAPHGQIEEGDVEEGDPVGARGDKVPGPASGVLVLRGRAEEDVEENP